MREPSSEVTGQQALGSARDLILSIAQALVDDSAAVEVRIEEVEGGAVVIVTVAARDFGKILGKQGRTARSVRTILQAASMKHQKRYSLDIRSHDAV